MVKNCTSPGPQIYVLLNQLLRHACNSVVLQHFNKKKANLASGMLIKQQQQY